MYVASWCQIFFNFFLVADVSDYNLLTGEAEAILARAQATTKGINMVSSALKEHGGVEVSILVLRL